MGGLFGRNQAPNNDPFYNAVPPATGSPGGLPLGPPLGLPAPPPLGPRARPPPLPPVRPRPLPPARLPPLPPIGYDPSGGLGAYDPYEQYGLGLGPTSSIGNYGGPIRGQPNPFGGRYAQGLNQMPGVAPWNYGNYYLGNTTMQMMPLMLNKVHRYGQIQAMSALGNAGLLGPAPMMPSMPVMPSMPMMPYCAPSSFSMPMAAPMMAAATPLPVAFNPLVQGMYPMASMNPVNWMTPSSFMSALTSGPMPYRPPAFDFPSNVGMVMTVPYGTPNPLLSSPSFGGLSSPYNFGGGFSWGSGYSYMPPITAPTPPSISYYPCPVHVPQSYPFPYSAPVAIPNVQQVPFLPPVSSVAPPVITGGYQSLPVPTPAPLWPSQGVVTNGGFGQSAVMASNSNSTAYAPPNNQPANTSLPVYNAIDSSRFLSCQQVTSSLSNLGSNTIQTPVITPSQAKNENQFSQPRDSLSDRFRRQLPSLPHFTRSNYNLNRSQFRRDPVVPPILRGQLISDSGWLPKFSNNRTITSILSSKRRKRAVHTNEIGQSILTSSGSRVSFIPRRRRHHSSSSASEYDCAICQQQREKRRLGEYYDSSTISSLLSSPKEARRHRLISNESPHSTIPHTPTSFKQGSYKSHRRHPTRIKIKSKSSTPKQTSSPLLIRQSPIAEQQFNDTIHEEVEEEQEQVKKNIIDDNGSVTEQSDQYASKISLRSTEE